MELSEEDMAGLSQVQLDKTDYLLGERAAEQCTAQLIKKKKTWQLK